MKRVTTTILATALAAIVTLSACGCSERQKFDFSNVTSLADLSGAIIAAQQSTFHLKALEEQTEGVTVKQYADFSDLYVALTSGAIDGYVAEEPTAYAVVAKDPSLTYLALKNNSTGFTASESDTGIAIGFKKGNANLAAANAALALLDESKKQDLMRQCVEMSANKDQTYQNALAVTPDQVSENAPVFKVAMECAYDPYNWSQMTDANGAVKIHDSSLYANGYDVQIAKYVAGKLGMRLEIYAADWDSLIEGVQAGTYDAIIAGMSPTEERKKEIDFTECYYNSNLVIIYKK